MACSAAATSGQINIVHATSNASCMSTRQPYVTRPHEAQFLNLGVALGQMAAAAIISWQPQSVAAAATPQFSSI